MLLGKSKMSFLNSLVIKINTLLLINLDFCTSFKVFILPALCNKWEEICNNENMVKIPFFLIEKSLGKEADYTQYPFE